MKAIDRMIPDNELMFEVKQGNLDKVTLLYQKYSRVLFSYFYRMSLNSDLCEDLVQNVFFRLIKYRKTFRGNGKFLTWLFHIARNVGHDHYRKNKHNENTVEVGESDWKVEDDPGENIERREQEMLIRKALNQLTPSQREVVILSRYQDLKYKDIAGIINCSEGAVKARILRAMEKLRYIYHNTGNLG